MNTSTVVPIRYMVLRVVICSRAIFMKYSFATEFFHARHVQTEASSVAWVSKLVQEVFMIYFLGQTFSRHCKSIVFVLTGFQVQRSHKWGKPADQTP